jgi:hypothetical protein
MRIAVVIHRAEAFDQRITQMMRIATITEA